jgi:hypothetical protein
LPYAIRLKPYADLNGLGFMANGLGQQDGNALFQNRPVPYALRLLPVF